MNKFLWFLAGVLMVFVIVGLGGWANALSTKILPNGDYQMTAQYNIGKQSITFEQLKEDLPSLKSAVNTSTNTVFVFDRRNPRPQDINKMRVLIQQWEEQELELLKAKYSNGEECRRGPTGQILCSTVISVGPTGIPVFGWVVK